MNDELKNKLKKQFIDTNCIGDLTLGHLVFGTDKITDLKGLSKEEFMKNSMANKLSELPYIGFLALPSKHIANKFFDWNSENNATPTGMD